MSRALVPLANGFEDLEAISIIDVLRRGGVDVTTASIGASLSVRSAHGIVMQADALFPDVSDLAFDAIVLPGGGEGTQNLLASAELAERLRRQHEEGLYVCAICAAPIVLERAGVLEDGVHVTCYPSCQAEMARPCEPVPVIADEKVITGQGPGSALLFALVVLQHLEGDVAARKVADGMVTSLLEE